MSLDTFTPESGIVALLRMAFDRANTVLLADHSNLWPKIYPTKEISVEKTFEDQEINTPRINPATGAQMVNEFGQLLFDTTYGPVTRTVNETVPDLEKIQAIFAEMGALGAGITLVHSIFSAAVNAAVAVAAVSAAPGRNLPPEDLAVVMARMSPELLALANASIAYRDAATTVRVMDNRPPVKLTPDFATGLVTVEALPDPE